MESVWTSYRVWIRRRNTSSVGCSIIQVYQHPQGTYDIRTLNTQFKMRIHFSGCLMFDIQKRKRRSVWIMGQYIENLGYRKWNVFDDIGRTH